METKEICKIVVWEKYYGEEKGEEALITFDDFAYMEIPQKLIDYLKSLLKEKMDAEEKMFREDVENKFKKEAGYIIGKAERFKSYQDKYLLLSSGCEKERYFRKEEK